MVKYTANATCRPISVTTPPHSRAADAPLAANFVGIAVTVANFVGTAVIVVDEMTVATVMAAVTIEAAVTVAVEEAVGKTEFLKVDY